MHLHVPPRRMKGRPTVNFRSAPRIVASIIAGLMACSATSAEPLPGPSGPAADVAATAADTDKPAAAPGPQQRHGPLTIVSWHLDSASKAGAVSITPEPVQIWRHTFGAERTSRSEAHFDVTLLGADVVLLQGVPLLSHVRLLFPARDWRVVVSRQIVRPVSAAKGPLAGWGAAHARTPTTAIAVRYQRNVRIAGEQQITDVVVPLADPSGPSETPAAIAVRIRVDGTVVWIVSADLPAACGTTANAVPGHPPCEPQATLARWIAARPKADRVVVGGRHVIADAKPATGTPCPGEGLAEISHVLTEATAAPGPSGQLAMVPARAEEGTGCIARLDLDVQPPVTATNPP